MSASVLPADQIEQLKLAIESVPYARLLGLKLIAASAGEATLGLAIRPELSQNHGVVHGGAIASLIDTATAFAILTVLDPEEKVTTVDLTISYLRPAIEGELVSRAKVLRKGRRLFSVTAEVTNEAGILLATALSTYIKL